MSVQTEWRPRVPWTVHDRFVKPAARAGDPAAGRSPSLRAAIGRVIRRAHFLGRGTGGGVP